METFCYITGMAVLLVAMAAGAMGAAYVLTERLKWTIPFKPFNCWPCLTFWLTWGAVAAAAPKLAAGMVGVEFTREEGATVYALVLVGALLGLANFFFVKSKRKIDD